MALDTHTYTDDTGTERCDNCKDPADDCVCACTTCGDAVEECACDDGPAYPAVWTE